MKITAKLAYSQLKVNRSRTLLTFLAILLSTALSTAVCSFVASGNQMLVELLGEDYGEYGSSYVVLLMIPAAVFGILIVSMSITVISNVFRISAQERVAQFGVLKCTGATQKQITETVMYEGIWLCAVGIPLGVCTGLLLDLLGIQVANHYLGELNDLAHIMIKEINVSLHFVCSIKAILVSMGISFFTVLYAAYRPAHKAARKAAIDCIRGNESVTLENKELRESKLIGRFFGFEGILAEKNLRRNRHNFRATVISLSVGVILFVSLGGLASQADGIMAYMTPGSDRPILAEYTSAHDSEWNDQTQREEVTYLHPINTALGSKIAEQLEQYEDTSIIGIGNDWDTYTASIAKDQVTDEMKALYKEEGTEGKNIEGENAEENGKGKRKSYEYAVEIITLDQKNYQALCEKAGVPAGSNILLNHYSYNDFGRERNVVPFQSLKEIELKKADGSSEKIPVQGVLLQDQIPGELFYPNTNPIRLVVQDAEVSGFSWHAAPKDEKGFMAYANKVLEENFPSEEDDSYMAQGFNTRVYKMEEYMKVMNIAISLVAVFMYSFVALLMLIGLTNVISTLSTNVLMRAREFAVLKSVGMTTDGLRRMLKYESMLCTMKALLYGVPIGILVTVLINLPIRSMFPISYQLPWMSLLLCVIMVFLITWGTIMYAAHRLEQQNIIESIRAESGR